MDYSYDATETNAGGGGVTKVSVHRYNDLTFISNVTAVNILRFVQAPLGNFPSFIEFL